MEKRQNEANERCLSCAGLSPNGRRTSRWKVIGKMMENKACTFFVRKGDVFQANAYLVGRVFKIVFLDETQKCLYF